MSEHTRLIEDGSASYGGVPVSASGGQPASRGSGEAYATRWEDDESMVLVPGLGPVGATVTDRDAAIIVRWLNNGALAALRSPVAGTPREETDAARWRALLSAARFRVLGTAGFDNPGDYRHFGMEAWTLHRGGPFDNSYAISVLTEFADALRAAAPAPEVTPAQQEET